MELKFKVPQYYLDIINQLFEIEKKSSQLKEKHSIQRNIERLKDLLGKDLVKTFNGAELYISYYDPIGEKFDETRTDCEASIAGKSTDNLIITEVIKPIIRINNGGSSFIIQKAITIVESSK